MCCWSDIVRLLVGDVGSTNTRLATFDGLTLSITVAGEANLWYE